VPRRPRTGVQTQGATCRRSHVAAVSSVVFVHLRYPNGAIPSLQRCGTPPCIHVDAIPSGGFRIVWLRRRTCAVLLTGFRIVLCRGRGVACSLPSTSPGATMYTTRAGTATTHRASFCICDRVHFDVFVNAVAQSCTMRGRPVAPQQWRLPHAHAIPYAPAASACRFAAIPRAGERRVVALQQAKPYADSDIHEHCDCCAAPVSSSRSSPPFRAGPRVGNFTGSRDEE
jgi:hypothetical protein